MITSTKKHYKKFFVIIINYYHTGLLYQQDLGFGGFQTAYALFFKEKESMDSLNATKVYITLIQQACSLPLELLLYPALIIIISL